VIFRRVRFRALIERQLDLFEHDYHEVLAETEARLRSYNSAGRDEAEERFGDYQDALDEGTEILAALRDGYASTLAEEHEARYLREFNAAVARRLPPFALELENR
jgi:hypothetical protein